MKTSAAASMALLTSLFWIVSCGQDPAFQDLYGLDGDTVQDADAVVEEGVDVDGDGIPDLFGDGSGEAPPVYYIPEADPDDLVAIHKCMAKWKDVPFGPTITNYRKIFASVVVEGFGIGVEDTERTNEPRLTLIAAAVTVNSQVEYNLLNPNGFYCIKANVNVNSDLDVNLHCNARLADNFLGVDVGSNVPEQPAVIGVNVNSEVNINNIRPNGDQCLR